MLVKDLITKLQDLPQNLTVAVRDPGGYSSTIRITQQVLYRDHSWTPGIYAQAPGRLSDEQEDIITLEFSYDKPR